MPLSMLETIISASIPLWDVHIVLSFDLHNNLKAGLLLFSHLINEEPKSSRSEVMQVVTKSGLEIRFLWCQITHLSQYLKKKVFKNILYRIMDMKKRPSQAKDSLTLIRHREDFRVMWRTAAYHLFSQKAQEHVGSGCGCLQGFIHCFCPLLELSAWPRSQVQARTMNVLSERYKWQQAVKTPTL